LKENIKFISILIGWLKNLNWRNLIGRETGANFPTIFIIFGFFAAKKHIVFFSGFKNPGFYKNGRKSREKSK